MNENFYSGDGLLNDDDAGNVFNPNDTTELMPESIVLHTGKVINLTFGTTQTDNLSTRNLVSKKLITALKQSLELASIYVEINSIHISATTNGKHSTSSNHYKSLAIDISKINGIPIIFLGLDEKVVRLQSAFELVPNRRENFGPVLKLKNGLPWPIGGHQDHIHFSINGQ